MRKKKLVSKSLLFVVSLLIGVSYLPAYGEEAHSSWMDLSQFTLNVPDSLMEKEYLGLKAQTSFSLSQIPAKLVLIECLNLYCSDCHKQAAVANKVHKLIQEDPALSKDIKVLGICAGSNHIETEDYKDELLFTFPLFPDPNFVVHKMFGSPETPFTILLNNKGKVLFFRYGIVNDVDAFFGKIKQSYQQHSSQYTYK
jgi:peroxiredoxin